MTVSLANDIDVLRDEGFADDVILGELREVVGDLYGEDIDALLGEGFDASVIIDNMRDLPLEYESTLDTGESIAAGAVEGFVGASGVPIAEMVEPYMPLREGGEDLTLPRDVDQQLGEIEEPSFTQRMAAMMGDEDILPPSQIGIPESTREAVTDPSALSPSLSLLEDIPESEEGLSNILRGVTRGGISGSPFGPSGVLMGMTGGGAGAYVEQETGSPWAGIAADVLTGTATGIASDLLMSGARTPTSVNPMFLEADSRLQNRTVKAITSGKRSELQDLINRTSAEQLSAFEREASEIAPNRFSQMAATDVSSTERNANSLFKQGQLDQISNINLNQREAFSTVQETANKHFNEVVRPAERRAYTKAREPASRVQGQLETSAETAQNLLEEVERLQVQAREEMGPVAHFLRTLLEDIGVEKLPVEELNERLLQAFAEGESTVLRRLGISSEEQFLNLLSSGDERRLTDAAKALGLVNYNTLSGDQMIDVIQRANTWVGYENTERTFSKRLTEVVNQLKSDTLQTLGENEAAELLLEANALYSKNMKTWGTDYMKRVRFGQVPEDFLTHTMKETNFLNLKDAVFEYKGLQGIVEKQMAENMTRDEWAQVSKSLSPQANKSIGEILNLKDALATPSSREALRLATLEEVSKSLVTGQYPSQTMDMMNTVKGYDFLKKTFGSTAESREVFNSLERLFVQDIIESVSTEGAIDFKKATEVLKNKEIAGVVEKIGGKELLDRFRGLEKMSGNLSKNMENIPNQKLSTLLGQAGEKGKRWSSTAAMLYWFGVPTQFIAGMGIGGAGIYGLGTVFKKLVDAALRSPKIYSALESISRSKTAEELVRNISRLRPILDTELDAETLNELDAIEGE